MKATCPSCNAHLNIDDKKIPAGGARIKCPTCQNIFPVKPGASTGAVPLPGASAAPAPAAPRMTAPGAGAAVPLPGITSAPAQDTEWEDAPTRAQPAFIPPEAVPGATTRAAPPSNIGATGAKTKPPTVGAVPLPGITAAAPQSQEASWEEESTRVAPSHAIPEAAYQPPAADPPPGEVSHVDFGEFEPTDAGAVPLPGANGGPVHVSPALTRPPAQRGGGAVPLPGSYEPTMGGGHEASSYEPTHAGQRGSVPLPGAAGSYQPTHVGPPPGNRGVPLPGSGDYAPTQIGRVGGAVPLPGQADYAATQINPRGGGVPLPGASTYAPTHLQPAHESGAVPLPGESNAHTELTAQSPAYQPQRMFDEQAGYAPGLGDVPEASSGDFAEVPPSQSFELPPAPASFDLPPPDQGPASNGGFDFSDLPAPSARSEGSDFEIDNSPPPETDLPSPAALQADPGAFDFGPPPEAPPMPPPMPPPPAAPVNPAVSFGEVDMGAPSDLEFDPSSKPPSSDELEADLSAPLPPSKPAAPADGLEMLSFIDDTAKEAGVKGDAPSVRRYHIKRRSGKVFGPFEEAVVVKMLEDGQLLGNEEVSIDSETWQPIGTEGAFQGAIAKLMEQPSRTATSTQPSSGVPAPAASGPPGMSMPGNRPPPPSMERLKQLYEGRMAAVAVVQGKDPVPFAKRVPFIVAGVLAVMVIGAGIWSSTTRYGIFGLKVLFPAKVSQNTPEFAQLNEAKKGLLADTFKGYKASKEITEKLLRTKQYPEVRAVWIQAVNYLNRRYGAASAKELQQAEAEQENILILGEKHAEVAKALANIAISKKEYDKALTLVSAARARSDNDGDLELLFLKAEALSAKGQIPQAMTELKAVLAKDKASARAMHALGLLHLKQKELDLAAGRFEEALKVSPEHASSAVELASIELLDRKNAAKGAELVEAALTDDHKVNLAPAELGRALALKALVAAEARKPEEAIEAFDAALKADPGNVFAKGAYGALLVERHDYVKALPMLKDAAEKEQTSLPYVESYLNALIGLGKMDDATKVMAAASGRFPGNARIAFLSGKVEDGMDRTKQAEESYKRAISADPKMVEANVALAGLYLRLRRFNDAKGPLAAAEAAAPENATVHVGQGELALAEGDVDKAQAELNKAVELNPNLPGAFLGLSRTALAKDKPDIAEQQALKALKLDPKIHEGRLQYGTSLWKLGRLDEAIKELEQAKEDEPRSIAIPITLGAVAFDKGDLELATANLLGNALQKESGNPDANYYMARVKRKRAEYTQAIELMKKAIDHSGRRREFHYELGNIYADARKGNEAVDEWKAALGIDPKYADALEALGKSSLERNKQKDAIDYFERAMLADPERTRVQAFIGDAYAASGKWDKTIEAYLKALGAEPGMHEVYPKLANAYQEKKKWPDAIAWFRKATQADPSDQNSWLALGYVLKEKKDWEGAIGAFEEFLKICTEPKQKKEIIREISDLKESH